MKDERLTAPQIPQELLAELKLSKVGLSEDEQRHFLEAVRQAARLALARADEYPTHASRKRVREHAKSVTRSAAELRTAIEEGDDIAECAVEHLDHHGELASATEPTKRDLKKVRAYLENSAELLPASGGRPGKGWREAMLWHLADVFDRHGINPTSWGASGSQEKPSRFEATVEWVLDLAHDDRSSMESVKDLVSDFLKDRRANQTKKA